MRIFIESKLKSKLKSCNRLPSLNVLSAEYLIPINSVLVFISSSFISAIKCIKLFEGNLKGILSISHTNLKGKKGK